MLVNESIPREAVAVDVVSAGTYVFHSILEALVDISLVLEQEFPDRFVVQRPVNERQLWGDGGGGGQMPKIYLILNFRIRI